MPPNVSNARSPVSDDAANFFNASDLDSEYWTTYLAARPVYSADFYNIIYEYHATKGSGKFELAHDVGAGPGQVAEAVLSRIDRVHLSDINAEHLDVARQRLSETPEKLARTTFTCCSGTEIASHADAGTADFVLAGESLALMHASQALENFAQILRPGGTMAAWYYGRPMFSEVRYAPKCQDIYDKIVNKLFSGVIKGGGPAKQTQWQSTTSIMASWLDNIELPTSQWSNVERHKWNTDGPMTFYDDSACDFEVVRSSEIGPDDVVVEKTDRKFWGDRWSVDEVRRFIEVNLPPFADSDIVDEEIESWYVELATRMGGKEAKRDIAWPVVLLLATKTA